MSIDNRYWTANWKRLRLFVLDRDRWVCQVREHGCKHDATAVDHIDATIEGGAFWDPANLRATCKHCNSIRGGKLVRARQARYRNTMAQYDTRL